MKKIACIGTQAFTLGFRLAGIKVIANLNDKKNLLEQIYTLKNNSEVGIIIIDEEILERLQGHERYMIEESVSPVFVPLSTKSGSDNIRKLIIKSIGVDLWKGDS